MKKILFYLGLIVIWVLIYEIGVNILHIWKPYIFPTPLGVLQTIGKLIANGSMGIGILVTLQRVVGGYLLSMVIGVGIGLLTTRFKGLGKQISSFILGLQTLPSICWLPFAVLWFGIGESAILFVVVIGSTFAIAIAVQDGIRNINPLYLRAAHTMGAKGVPYYRDIVFPASLPTLISGLKQGWSFAWRALMAGEMLSATKGLGVILMQGRDFADINQVMAMMIVIVVLGLLIDKLVFGRAEKSVRRRWGLDRA
ncbi:MAG: ABC transporter permease [Ethanoligenens sp.]